MHNLNSIMYSLRYGNRKNASLTRRHVTCDDVIMTTMQLLCTEGLHSCTYQNWTKSELHFGRYGPLKKKHVIRHPMTSSLQISSWIISLWLYDSVWSLKSIRSNELPKRGRWRKNVCKTYGAQNGPLKWRNSTPDDVIISNFIADHPWPGF